VKQRILVFSDCPYFAGCENMIANILNWAHECGRFQIGFLYRASPAYVTGMAQRIRVRDFSRFTVISPSVDSVVGKLRSVLGPVNVVFSQAVSVLSVLATMLEVRRVLRRFKPCLIHINNGGYPAAVSAYGAVLAIRFFYPKGCLYVVNNLASWRWGFKLMERVLDRMVSATVSVFVTGSLEATKALRARLGGGRRKYLTIHNGVELREHVESSLRSAYLDLVESARCAGRLSIAVVATLEERKGHRHLIEALGILEKRIGKDRMPLTLIEGRGPLEAGLKEMARDLGLGDCVKFVGTLEDVYQLVQSVDLLALPSTEREDFPNVVLEAMMFGKPVVASIVGGTPEQVVHGRTGLLVPPGDSAALAGALEELVDSPSRLAEMGALAKKRYQDYFTARASVVKYCDLYARVAKEER
jgi:glycosyltransferase involved in cell wall biosynthesis